MPQLHVLKVLKNEWFCGKTSLSKVGIGMMEFYKWRTEECTENTFASDGVWPPFFYSIFFDADVMGNSYFRGKGLSKNKPTCKNAVGRIYGSWTLLSPLNKPPHPQGNRCPEFLLTQESVPNSNKQIESERR